MNIRLLVLGLLREQPRYGYELLKWLEESRTDLWANVLPGSIYHALRQLHKEGLIAVEQTEQTGHRMRAIYGITEDGRAAFDAELDAAWQDVPQTFPSQLYLALTFSHHLPPELLRRRLDQLAAALEQQLAVWTEGEALKGEQIELDAGIRAMFKNGRDHIRADLELVQHLRALLDTPESRWPQAQPRRDLPPENHRLGDGSEAPSL